MVNPTAVTPISLMLHAHQSNVNFATSHQLESYLLHSFTMKQTLVVLSILEWGKRTLIGLRVLQSNEANLDRVPGLCEVRQLGEANLDCVPELYEAYFNLVNFNCIVRQVWTTLVWTEPRPTGTDRFETESNRTDTIGPVRSKCKLGPKTE